MRVLGLDLGTKTLGVSISDISNTLACPLTTIKYNDLDYNYLVNELKKIVKEKNITHIALGFPKNMDNSLGDAAKRSISFKELLDRELDIDVELIDERLSTVEAYSILKDNEKNMKKSKKIVDSIAASIILETYLRRINNER